MDKSGTIAEARDKVPVIFHRAMLFHTQVPSSAHWPSWQRASHYRSTWGASPLARARTLGERRRGSEGVA